MAADRPWAWPVSRLDRGFTEDERVTALDAKEDHVKSCLALPE
jgi:hypothetical protein